MMGYCSHLASEAAREIGDLVGTFDDDLSMDVESSDEEIENESDDEGCESEEDELEDLGDGDEL
jgi:hypothetical protein